MNAPAIDQSQVDAELLEQVRQFVHDPLGFVYWAFPWGQPGPLADAEGPDDWQAALLLDISDDLEVDPWQSIQDATSSGHGIGKSAMVSWLILWMMNTRPNLAGWVTANTKTQLTSKTWRELAVWHSRCKTAHWFRHRPTRYEHLSHPETWGLDAIPWSAHNSEAFAGLHEKHVLMIMDEASAIDDVIWEVAEGAMTTPGAMWFTFGNPTQNTGRFRECFGKFRHRWRGRKIDARKAKMTDKTKLAEWEQDHGEDSDFFRVRVRGEFPRFGTNQLISSEDVHRAWKYEIGMDQYIHFSNVLGVDVARFGTDETVVARRQGRKVYPLKIYRGLNNMQVASRVAAIFRDDCNNRGAILVDETGLGSGVVDRLVQLGYPVIGVIAAAKAEQDTRFYNKRAEMWFRMGEWFEGAVDIPDDSILAEQCTALEYSYDLKERIKLETKDDLKERLPHLGSPDRGDALALTFAEQVVPNMQQDSIEPEPDPEDY